MWNVLLEITFADFVLLHAQRLNQKGTNSDFSLRTEELRCVHIETACETGVACCGSLFKVTAGSSPSPRSCTYLFEGVVPFEIAECLQVLIDKKYLTLESLNRLVQVFPYRCGGTD